MNNNRMYIIAAAVVALLVVGGGGYYFLSASKPVEVEDTSEIIEEEVIPSISPDELGLVFESNEKPNALAVRFVISKPEGIEHIEYEIIYDAKVDGNTVTQGLGGEVTQDQFGNDEIAIKFRELGTCSSGRCRFDQGVESIKLILKITKTDGKHYKW